MSKPKESGKSAVNDFIDGQKDCKNGARHKDGGTEFYDQGYAFQYEKEARASYDR